MENKMNGRLERRRIGKVAEGERIMEGKREKMKERGENAHIGALTRWQRYAETVAAVEKAINRPKHLILIYCTLI